MSDLSKHHATAAQERYQQSIRDHGDPGDDAHTKLVEDWKERVRYHPNPTEEENIVLDGITKAAMALGEYLIDQLNDGPELRRALNKVWEAKAIANCSVLVRGLR